MFEYSYTFPVHNQFFTNTSLHVVELLTDAVEFNLIKYSVSSNMQFDFIQAVQA